MLKEKDHQPRILYPMTLSFKSEGEIVSQINKIWDNLLLVQLPCKEMKFFREKENDIDLHKERGLKKEQRIRAMSRK